MSATILTPAAGTVMAMVLLFAVLAAQASSGLALDGQPVQGGLVRGHVPAGTQVRFQGRDVRVSQGGVFLLGFPRDAKPQARLEIGWPDGSSETVVLAVRQREYEVQRIDGLPPSRVSPSAAQLRRIEKEAALVRRARLHDDARTDFLDGFDWPLAGEITGVYGSQRILNGEPRQPHYGVDIAAPAGTPVRAPAPGIVRLAQPDLFLSGGTLIIDHGHGLSSTFIHLERILVAEGTRVKRGQKVALVGATGRATGAHLDWRINLFEDRLDPRLVARPMPLPGR